MGHGWPDYRKISAMKTVHPIFDVGEAAVRLGSIVTFDRRGDVIFLDSFEDGLAKFKSIAGGTGASIVLSTKRACSGAYSAKLTAGSDGSQSAAIYAERAYPVVSNIGIEFAFTVEANTEKVQLGPYIYTGTKYLDFRVRYNHVNKTLEYVDSTGTWTVLATGIKLHESDILFHRMKLVFDMENEKYIRLILDDKTYDMENLICNSGASTITPYLYFNIIHYGAAGTNAVLYVDDVILTQNEPA